MRRALILLATLSLFTGASALAVPGPDPNNGDPYGTGFFELIVHENTNLVPDPEQYDRTVFQVADGWDFGDRRGYRCAWIELHPQGVTRTVETELGEVHYRIVEDYEAAAGLPTGGLVFDDKYGQEGPEDVAASLCDGGLTPENGIGQADAPDHFPHGVDIVFYQGGVEVGRVIYQDTPCANGYWTPGSQPGEAWLWWDEDGPGDKFMHGDGLCGGGPIEPIAVQRARVLNVAPGVDYCSEALDGSRQCTFPTETTATFSLSGSLDDGRPVMVDGNVIGLPDAPTSCGTGMIVLADGREVSTTVCL